MTGFRYRAFISYSHADRRWGHWLHRTLEGYRVPRKLVGMAGVEGPVPARLTPVFRDLDDLPAAAIVGRADRCCQHAHPGRPRTSTRAASRTPSAPAASS